jgi:hypothetical protein
MHNRACYINMPIKMIRLPSIEKHGSYHGLTREEGTRKKQRGERRAKMTKDATICITWIQRIWEKFEFVLVCNWLMNFARGYHERSC